MRQNRKSSNWIQWIIHRHFVVTKLKAKNGFDGIALEFCHTHSSKCVQTIFGGAQNQTQWKISAKPTDFVDSHKFFFSRSVVVVANLIHFQSKFYDYGGFCRLQFLCMALDLCGKLAYPIFVFNSFMRSEPLLCASNRQSDQHRFSFVNISDAVIEFDEIMADGEICIQMCCGFSFMVF